jgi:tetratricopeptide (TPR) repeat protein
MLEEIRAGMGGLALVSGEAGIGKTTLAKAVAGHAAQTGLMARMATAGADANSPALAPWTQLLTAHLGGLPADDGRRIVGDAREAAELLSPEIARRLDLAAEDGGQILRTNRPQEGDRRWLLRQLVGVWLRAADDTPHGLLVILDDLHLLDLGSAMLLAELATGAAGHRLALVGTLRPGEAAEPLAAVLAELYRHARVTLQLPGLPSDATAALVERAGLAASPELLSVLATRTGGNPFFLTQLVTVLRSHAPHAQQVLAVEVPSHVVEVIQRRLARLPQSTAAMLEAAAVLGLSGTVEVLARTSGQSVWETVAELDRAIVGGLLADAGAGRWRFVHALVRDAVVAGLANQPRCALHARALAALRDSEPPASTAELAWHAAGGLPLTSRLDAARLSRAAAAEATARYAYEDAATQLERALVAGAGELGLAERREIQVELGLALRAAGDIESARRAFGAALEQQPDGCELPPPLLATAALGFADPGADLGLAYTTDGPASETLLQTAIDRLGDREPTLAVRLYSRLGAQLYFSAQPELGRPLAERALAIADALEDPHSRVIAGLAYHDAYIVGQAPPREALARSSKLLALARQSRDPHAVLGAHRARVFDLIASGDIDAVDAEIEAFRREAAQVRVPAYEWWLGLWRAMRTLLAGDHSQAERLALDTQALGQRFFPGLAGLNFSFLLFFLRREQGRLAELAPVFDAFASATADIPAILPARALFLAEEERLDEASGLLARAADDGFGRLRDRNWPVSWFQLARVAWLTGDREQAEALFTAGVPLAGSCIMVSLGTVCLGAADLGLAWAAAAMGDPGAVSWYQQAAATNARIGARPWLAEARLGGALYAVDTGDRDMALRLAELAGTAAAELGMSRVAETARQLIAATGSAVHGGHVPRGAEPDAGVFRRDGPVWELSYAGRTIRLPHAKGLSDLAMLLRTPGEPVHVSELLSAQAPQTEVAARSGADIFDARARREIRARLQSLADDEDDARAMGDLERAARAKTERDRLVTAVTSAAGLGGQPRALGDPLERARKTVTARIRNSIRRIGALHPALGRHLDRAVDTGVWCVYRPERRISWQVLASRHRHRSAV